MRRKTFSQFTNRKQASITDMKVEPWEVMEAVLSYTEFVGFLKGSILKYTVKKDIGKAKYYMKKLKEVKNEGYN